MALDSSIKLSIADTALRFIQDNSHRPIVVRDVAAHCGVERRTLERYFQRAGMFSVGRRIIEERLVRTEHLLGSSSLLIKEIANACGFGNPQRMIYDFRHFRHCPPREIRRRSLV